MKIVLFGYGRMGHEIERVAINRGHEIVTTIDSDEDFTLKINDIHRADMAIEFSTPATVIQNINRCFELHLPIVVGTTNWAEQLPEITQRVEKEGLSLFHAPNFSLGMNFIFHLNKELADFAKKYNYSLGLSETHHIHKLDKPSGTAIRLANDIISNNNNYSHWCLKEEIVDSDSSALVVDVHREGEIFGIHEVKASSSSDELSIRHEAFSRSGFAEGAVLAAEFLLGKKGVHTMEELF